MERVPGCGSAQVQGDVIFRASPGVRPTSASEDLGIFMPFTRHGCRRPWRAQALGHAVGQELGDQAAGQVQATAVTVDLLLGLGRLLDEGDVGRRAWAGRRSGYRRGSAGSRRSVRAGRRSPAEVQRRGRTGVAAGAAVAAIMAACDTGPAEQPATRPAATSTTMARSGSTWAGFRRSVARYAVRPDRAIPTDLPSDGLRANPTGKRRRATRGPAIPPGATG